MGSRARVFRRAAAAARECRREALVECLHRHFQYRAERFDEPVGLECLGTALSAERQGQADDNELRTFVADEVGEAVQPCLRACSLDDRERARERPGRIGDGHARARRAVVQCEHLQLRAETISRSASASASPSRSGCFPPARAIVGRPHPPPPISAAACFTTAPASRPRA